MGQGQYSSADVAPAGQYSADDLAPPPEQHEQPGFFKRAAEAAGIPTSGQGVASAIEGMSGAGMLYHAGKAALDVAKKTYQEGKEVGQNLKEGGPILPNVGKAAAAILPGAAVVAPIGGALNTMGADIANKNYAGAAGGATGVLAQTVLPEAVNKALPAIQRTAGEMAPDIYRSAMKPTTVPSKQAAVQRGIETGLDYGIPVSAAGVEKLSGLIDQTNRAIADTIASRPGQTVNKFRVAGRLSDTADAFKNQVAPSQDLSTISRVGNDFLATNPANIAAADAQAMKQGTYQQVKRNYGSLSPASVEAQKALARGLKEELSNAFPELQALNAQDSRFYGLEPLIERAVARDANHQLIGIGTPAVGMATKAVTNSSKMAMIAGVMKAVVDNPAVKSRLAIMLSRSSRGSVSLGQAMTRVTAYSAALEKASGDDNGQPDGGPASQ